MQLLSNTPKFGPFAARAAFSSDIAFWGEYAIQGNYNGFQVADVSDPEAPAVVSQVRCPGSQNDVSVWRNLIFTSTASRRNDASCDSFQLASNTVPSSTDPGAEYWEGIKIFDWSNPAAPRLVAAVETWPSRCCSRTVASPGRRARARRAAATTSPSTRRSISLPAPAWAKAS